MNVENEVLEKIRPSPELMVMVSEVSSDLLNLVNEKIRELGQIDGARLVGSVAKNTYLNDPDIDIFILFHEDVSRKDLESIGINIGRDLLDDQEERFAEHPYLHGTYRGFDVDLVPCYHIKDPAHIRSAVDRTPFHTDYISAALTDRQRDDVRLLKQFMKAIGTYGAEAKVQGFSGYLVELLIIRFGSFHEVIEEAANWKYGIKLDLVGNGTTKFPQPLIFYDPVDPGRNVASALSQQKFALFIQACKDFKDEPSERYFFPLERGKISAAEIQTRIQSIGADLIGIVFIRPDIIDDNLHPQAKKSLEGMLTLLKTNDFVILDQDYHISDDRTTFLFLIQQEKISPAKKHVGPPVWIENSKAFLDRWEQNAVIKPYIEDGRWTAMVPRQHTSAMAMLRSEMFSGSLGSSFKGKSFEVMDYRTMISKGMLAELSHILDKRMPWKIE